MKLETFKALRKDICDIVYCLSAPEPQDDGQEEFDRFEKVIADQDHFEKKYGEDLINHIRAVIHDIPNQVGGIIHD
jgi:hypothetical protein